MTVLGVNTYEVSALQVIIGVFGSAIVLAFVLDALKAIIFRSLRMV